MSEMIYNVKADRPQAFTSAEMAQARANIGAQASGDYAYNSSLSAKLDASASSMFQPSGDYLTAVSHSVNFTGDGTSGNPLGLSSTVELVYNNNTARISPYNISIHDTAYSGEYGQYASIWCTPDESATAGAGMFRSQNSSADMRIYSDRMEISEGDFGFQADASSVYVNQRNGGADGALLTISSLTITSNTHPKSQLTKTGLYLYDNYGNPDSNVQTKYSTYGITWESPLPGNNWIVTTANANGLKNVWTDMSAYTADYVADHFAMSHSAGNCISASVDTGNNQFGLFMQHGTASAKFGVSDVQKWNDCITSVSAGVGLSGDGTYVPLSVTGLSYDYTSIYQTSRTHISSEIDMTMDSNRHTLFSPYGVRIEETGESPNHSALAEMGYDKVYFSDYASNKRAELNASGISMTDNGSTVTIDASTWSSLTAWATAQGWTP